MTWLRGSCAGVLPLLLCAVVLSLAPITVSTSPPAAAPATSSPLPSLDPDCVRFLDPSAVVNGEIAYTNFSSYAFAVDHAAAAWSPLLGFAIPLREVPPEGNTIPSQATLVVRDAHVSSTPFKGVTVTWTNAPATITLNQATLPPPHTTSTPEVTTILSVMTHEFGHALGLGDVPPPGVTIRECANMLMKRSVDRGGGAFTAPQPDDIALYCLRWGGAICGENQTAASTPGASLNPEHEASASVGATGRSDIPYFFSVIACDTRPFGDITSETVRENALPERCARAPAGVLFNVAVDGSSSYSMLTNGNGEFAVLLPDGGTARVSLPRSGDDLFPSLVGFRPAIPEVSISSADPACAGSPSPSCHTVFVLFSDD